MDCQPGVPQEKISSVEPPRVYWSSQNCRRFNRKHIDKTVEGLKKCRRCAWRKSFSACFIFAQQMLMH
jgi:hypothetical protein